MDGGEPDIPIYKVIECTGPTNTRVYKVAVYFRGKRLASSTGHSIQQAEMEAAKKALENSSELFPQLDYQKRVMAHSMKRQKGKPFDGDRKRNRAIEQSNALRKQEEEDSNLPKQYRVWQKSKGKASNKSDTESDSESDWKANCSDSAHSSCSLNKIMQNKNHSHRKDHRTKCQEDSYSGTESENIVQFKAKIDESIDEEIKYENIQEDNAVLDSDTDISLESGEIL